MVVKLNGDFEFFSSGVGSDDDIGRLTQSPGESKSLLVFPVLSLNTSILIAIMGLKFRSLRDKLAHEGWVYQTQRQDQFDSDETPED